MIPKPEPRIPKTEPRLKPLGSPSPIRVRTNAEGVPIEIERRTERARGRAMEATAGKVAVIREVWRIDDEWWRRPISRLYYEVVLETGKLATLYLDLVEGEWWEQ